MGAELSFHLRDSAVPGTADAAAGTRCLAALAGKTSKVVDAILDLIADGIAPVVIAGLIAVDVGDL